MWQNGFVWIRLAVPGGLERDRATAAPSCHRLSIVLEKQLRPFRVEMTPCDSPPMHADRGCPTVVEMRQVGIVLNRFADAGSVAASSSSPAPAQSCTGAG